MLEEETKISLEEYKKMLNCPVCNNSKGTYHPMCFSCYEEYKERISRGYPTEKDFSKEQILLINYIGKKFYPTISNNT